MSDLTWDDVFTELSRRKMGRVSKTVTQADQIEWAANINDIPVHITSTICSAANRSELHFLTSSNARLSFSADFANYVELRVEPKDLPTYIRAFILQLADLADDRCVVLM